MSVLTPTTRLDAVNDILAFSGERPVSSIADTSQHNVLACLHFLDDATVRLQAESWWFNRAEEVTLRAAQPTGYYDIPPNYRSVKLSRPEVSDYRWAVRGTRFYNMDLRTDEGFTEDLLIDFTETLTFDFLPANARTAIVARATVYYALSRDTSRDLIEEARANIQLAMEDLTREELENTNSNIGNMPEVNRVMQRRA